MQVKNMEIVDIRERLFNLKDEKYKEFQSGLIPTIDKEAVIGVRTPELRTLAKELRNSAKADEIMSQLPHRFFEENQLHAFLISEIKDYNRCVDEVERFLPYIDNWATCDQMNPKILKKHTEELLPYIEKWINSKHTYTIRYGIKCLMDYYLDDLFDVKYADMVCSVVSDEYYVNMMIAWYFATALAKQYEAVLTYIENHRLDEWTRKKAIQKARESKRVTKEQKEYLKELS